MDQELEVCTDHGQNRNNWKFLLNNINQSVINYNLLSWIISNLLTKVGVDSIDEVSEHDEDIY